MVRRVEKSLMTVVMFAFMAVGVRGAPPFERTVLQVGGAVFSVELAVTPAQRQQGLMYREMLPLFSGMLFVFPSDQVLGFWMKNTSIPLSIAYIDAGGVIVCIKELEPYSLEPVLSGEPVRYALEVNRGVFEMLGIGPGQRVDVTQIRSRIEGRVE